MLAAAPVIITLAGGRVPAAAMVIYAAVIALLLFFIPFRRHTADEAVVTAAQYDERDIMFARIRYEPGSEAYEEYYRRNPQKKLFDDRLRGYPRLGEPGSEYYHPLNSPVANAAFELLEKWRPLAEGEAERRPVELDRDEITRRLKGLASYYGADEVGVAALRPYHVYSHIGRGAGRYGEKVVLPHTFAVIFAVQMNYRMIRNAPGIGVIAESSRYYVETAKIALVIAGYIRSFGYKARAHIDGNYRIILPAVAASAGLGEIGRLGLLVTEAHGPRVRLGAVTTNLPLIADAPKAFGVEEFCARCKKCAENCPSGAISKEEKRAVRGVEKWTTNQEACYRKWLELGSDCGLCISVCPYSKPDTFLHSVIRYSVKRSLLGRRVALYGDDLLYGRTPRIKVLPEWMR